KSAGEADAVREVVANGPVRPSIHRLQAIVPPGEKRGPDLGRTARILGRKPLPRGRIVVGRLWDAVSERPEVEGATAARIVAGRPQARGREIRDLLIVVGLEVEGDRGGDRPP